MDNFQLCQEIRNLALIKPDPFYMTWYKDEAFESVLESIVADYIDETFTMDDFDFWFAYEPNKKVRATILSIPNAEKEFDCNYIAICFQEKMPIAFLSERFENGDFCLVKETLNDRKICSLEPITSVESLWNQINEQYDTIDSNLITAWYYKESEDDVFYLDIDFSEQNFLEKLIGNNYTIEECEIDDEQYLKYKSGENESYLLVGMNSQGNICDAPPLEYGYNPC